MNISCKRKKEIKLEAVRKRQVKSHAEAEAMDLYISHVNKNNTVYNVQRLAKATGTASILLLS